MHGQTKARFNFKKTQTKREYPTPNTEQQKQKKKQKFKRIIKTNFNRSISQSKKLLTQPTNAES